MTTELGRRDALRLGGLAGLGGVLAACTGSSGPHPPRSTGPATPSVSASSSSGLASVPSSSSRAPSRPTFAQLAKQMSGQLAQRGQRGYDADALLYNPRFRNQKPPQAIAHCARASDVVACVKFAADGGAPLRMRNGGHSYGGWSSGPGLVVDMSGINAVRVNRSTMTATVGAGARLADVYTELAAHGVAIGAGSCATVGVTGLALGGGVGLLSRAYGLTCDQLAAIQVVTADGKLRNVDAHTDADLFWALRGGGGSFGAVTELTFHVRPAPVVDEFFIEWPWSAAGQVLDAWQNWMRGAPRELMTSCKLLADPGGSMTPSVTGCWIGSSPVDGQLSRLLAHTPRPSNSYRNRAGYGQMMLALAGCSGQTAQQCITAALSPAKRQPSAATSSIQEKLLPQPAIHAIVDAVATAMDVPSLVEGGVSFDSLGGAVSEPAADATAFPWRTALADVQYTATWPYALATQDPGRYDQFVHRERAALTPWLGSAAYVNYADPSFRDYASAYWGSNLSRLQQVKRSYDPHNVFSFPQSVPE